MADVKNFGISGVGSDVQLGKAGAHIKSADGHVEIRNPDNSALTTARGANAVVASEFVTLAQLQAVQSEAGNAVGAVDGFSVKLGDVTTKGDGSWLPGAVPLDNATPVSEAVDRLNEVLAKLVPAAPPNFPNGTLSVSNPSGNTPFLASGAVPDNTAGGSLPTAGTAVTRITATGVNSNTFTGVGPGETGTVQLLVNNAVAGSKTLTGTGDNGTFNGLTIAGQADYPVSTPGFWKSINVAVSAAAVAAGLNRFKLNHTAAGTTNEVTFVRDTMTSAAALSAGTVAQNVAGAVSYSSGVPHYATGGSLSVGFTLANLSGETYYGGTDPVVLSGTNGVISNQIVGYAGLGLTTPLARNLAATAVSPITLQVNGTNVFAMGTVQAVVKNVNATNAAVNVATTNILAMIGTQAGKVYELSFPVSGLGSIPNNNNGVRVNLPAGDNPAGSATAFDSSAALATYEAAVVAGVLKHDKTNYSTGYLPAGPDYSVGRDGAQYVTVSFNRSAVSKFSINVTGTYAAAWVKIPGVSDNASISANGAAANGWWDMFKPYDGAGVPGETGDPLNGAAVGNVMTGSSGSFVATFGTQTSTNSTGNQILVRLKLNPGQSISALSFSA